MLVRYGEQLASGTDQDRCPLWVISRHVQCKRACPLYPPKADIRRDVGVTASGCKMFSLHNQRMCGRFTNRLTWREIVALYRLSVPAGPERNLPASLQHLPDRHY